MGRHVGMHSAQTRESLCNLTPIAGSSTEARRAAQPLPTEEAIEIASLSDKHSVCIRMLVLRYAALGYV